MVTRQPKPMTWQSINRYKWFDEEFANKIFTVEDLRKMLKDWTWEKLLEQHQRISTEGVMFHGRIGCFMAKPCIAICALGHIVVLRYVTALSRNWAIQNVIDGTRQGGLLLVVGDFVQGRAFPIKLSDLVIEGEQ